MIKYWTDIEYTKSNFIYPFGYQRYIDVSYIISRQLNMRRKLSFSYIEQIFMGNNDGDSIVENSFDCPIFAKGIRLIPMGWNNHIAMRFDVSGCHLDNTIVGKNMLASINMQFEHVIIMQKTKLFVIDGLS